MSWCNTAEFTVKKNLFIHGSTVVVLVVLASTVVLTRLVVLLQCKIFHMDAFKTCFNKR